MNIKEILGKKILVFDGALGTALQSAGLKGGEFSESFNFNHPEIVKDIYKNYIKAGSRVLSSNTFSSNKKKLEGQPFDDKESIMKAIQIAREAISESREAISESEVEDVFVAHDIGPSGELMKPVGTMDFDTVYDLFKRQVEAGREAGADFHFFETFSDISELKVGILAAKENSDLPVICSITFNEDGRMLLGTDPETAVYMLQDMGVAALGVNCSLGPKEMVPLVKRMLAVAKVPILVQPNAGMPKEKDGETYYDVTPDEFAEHMLEMIESGAAAVGGCCGTTNQFISTLTQRINMQINELSKNNNMADNNRAADRNNFADKNCAEDSNNSADNNHAGDSNNSANNNLAGDSNNSADNNLAGDSNNSADNNRVADSNHSADNNHSNTAEGEFPGISAYWYNEKLEKSQPTACTVSSHALFGEDTIIIGERINPTGRKDLKKALKEQDYAYIESEAINQQNAGAHIVNLNVGMEGIDEQKTMEDLTEAVSAVIDVPLQIDSSNYKSIEAGIRKYRGKPIINSVNGEQASMDKVFPLVKKYGTAVIALTLDEGGIPKTVDDRLKILDKLIKEAAKYGITKDRIIVDTLALTVSTDPMSAVNTLKAIEAVTNKYKMNTVLGASNISFGLPQRSQVNKAFLSMAIYAGISSVITDPTKQDYMDEIMAADVLSGRDQFAERYICYNDETESDKSEKKVTKKLSLKQVILDGREGMAEDATNELLKEMPPMDIVNNVVIPSLQAIGENYETGEIFLPQMIKSAEAVSRTFDVLKPIIAGEGKSISKGKIVVATVKGDIHDIGKNIVKTVLENYGYDIIDLGKDVPTETIIDTIVAEKAKFVGLSALMTTTMVNMKPVIDEISDQNIDCKVAVGGAVLTQEYSDKIGADFYCETAMDTVRAAEKTFKK